jgi:hypothetical protein
LLVNFLAPPLGKSLFRGKLAAFPEKIPGYAKCYTFMADESRVIHNQPLPSLIIIEQASFSRIKPLYTQLENFLTYAKCCASFILRDYRLTVEKRFLRANDPDSYAGG